MKIADVRRILVWMIFCALSGGQLQAQEILTNNDLIQLVNSGPDAGTDGNVELCANGTPISLFAQLGGTPQFGGVWTSPQGLPSSGIFLPGLDPEGAFTYTVNGSGACGSATATVLVSVLPAPNAGVSSSVTVCSVSAPIDMRLALGGTPDLDGTWSGPSPTSGLFDPASVASGTYTYTYTVSGNGTCQDASATLTITVVTAANAGMSGTVEVCAGGAPFSLFPLLGGAPQAGGTWTRQGVASSGVFDPLVSEEGIYTYTVWGTVPCANASAQLMVNVIDLQLQYIDGITYIGDVEPLTYSALPFLADADSFSWSIPEGWTWATPDSTSGTVVLLPPEQETNATICVRAYGGGCIGNEVCLTPISVSVNTIPNSGNWFSVHPNPSDGIFQLTPQGSHGGRTEIMVHDALGQLVAGPFVLADQQPYTLRLEDRSSGMYFMRVVRGGEVKVMELLIQR